MLRILHPYDSHMLVSLDGSPEGRMWFNSSEIPEVRNPKVVVQYEERVVKHTWTSYEERRQVVHSGPCRDVSPLLKSRQVVGTGV